jgi:serine/threonine protein kinase
MGHRKDDSMCRRNASIRLNPPRCETRQLSHIGFGKHAKTRAGTIEYMAPEVVKEELYDGRCDWWSIGIILYEV